MTEPTSTAIATAGGIMVAGVATGLPADLIFPGFVGAVWALRDVAEGGHWARVAQVVVGTLLAAWAAAPLALFAASVVPGAASIPAEMLRYPLAFAVGWGGLSIGLRRIGRVMGGDGK